MIVGLQASLSKRWAVTAVFWNKRNLRNSLRPMATAGWCVFSEDQRRAWIYILKSKMTDHGMK